ncbi:MAG TPA: saccharopine dehydrogenase family protein [Alphaproteobacteria bacterium]|nr:saccharopine dehydrogenase family protein [Alphaproteobacteria bacterium]
MVLNSRDVVVVGAGKIGSTVAEMLIVRGNHRVTLADRDVARIAGIDAGAPIAKAVIEVDTAPGALAELARGKFAIINAAPYHLTTRIADAAREAGVHYLDLTEDVASTRHVKQLAERAESAFIPQCGLAPGFVSIVANDLAQRFDVLDSIRLRVGALPRFPSNGLNYNLTWSTDGVINEYCEPCEAIVGGVRREVPAMEEREEFALDGVTYEAFNTSGGLGSLCETYLGRVRELNYRTVRYPGHAAIMKTLLHDLRLRDRRHVLKDILEYALPATLQDVVIVFVAVSGVRGGRYVQETYANKVYGSDLNGRARSAIQMTTAAGVCGVLDLLSEGVLPARGFVRQEDVPLNLFLRNRFGQIYATSPGRPSRSRRHPAAAKIGENVAIAG